MARAKTSNKKGSKTSKKTKVIVLVTIGVILLLAALILDIFLGRKIVSSAVSDVQTSENIRNSASQVVTLLDSGKNDQAMTVAHQMVASAKSNNDKAIAFQSLGSVYFSEKDCQTAKTYFTQALSLYKNLPEAYMAEGECELTAKNYQPAIDDSQKSLSILETQKSQVNTTTGDDTELSLITRDEGASHFEMAAAYLGLGNKTEAVKEIQNAISIDPSQTAYKTALDKLQATPKPKPTNPPIVGNGYTKQDLDNLTNQDIQFNTASWVIPLMTNNSKYNQQAVQEESKIISQATPIAERLLAKMNSNLPFNQTDINDFKTVESLDNQLTTVLQHLNN